MTRTSDLAQLRSGPEGHFVADADRARDVAIRALDAPNRKDQETADDCVGYISNALESAIYELRAGA